MTMKTLCKTNQVVSERLEVYGMKKRIDFSSFKKTTLFENFWSKDTANLTVLEIS